MNNITSAGDLCLINQKATYQKSNKETRVKSSEYRTPTLGLKSTSCIIHAVTLTLHVPYKVLFQLLTPDIQYVFSTDAQATWQEIHN